MNTREALSASAALATVLAASAGSGAASAAPAGEASAGCRYALSTPQLVIVPGGGRGIRANMTPTNCAPDATPTDVTVCVEAPDGNSQCKQTPGWSLAEIIVPASSSGVYTSTGTGCWLLVLESFRPGCQTAGPVNATI